MARLPLGSEAFLQTEDENVRWRLIALTDPDVQEWWGQIQKRAPELKKKGVSVIQFMEEQMRRDDGYNYKDALLSGIRPSYLDPSDMMLHWGGRNPKTGEILKGKKHPTYHKSLEDKP